MSKSGLYAHFGSKEELQLATVETANEIFEADVVAPTATIDDPLEHLRAISDAFLSTSSAVSFPEAASSSPSGAEFDMHPGSVKDRLITFQGEWSGRLEHLIGEAQAAHALDPAEEPAQLAFELNAFVLRGNTDFVPTTTRSTSRAPGRRSHGDSSSARRLALFS